MILLVESAVTFGLSVFEMSFHNHSILEKHHASAMELLSLLVYLSFVKVIEFGKCVLLKWTIFKILKIFNLFISLISESSEFHSRRGDVFKHLEITFGVMVVPV